MCSSDLRVRRGQRAAHRIGALLAELPGGDCCRQDRQRGKRGESQDQASATHPCFRSAVKHNPINQIDKQMCLLLEAYLAQPLLQIIVG